MNNHSKDATKQSKTVKRAWRINQQVDRTIKTPKLPKEGSIHYATRCPRAQIVKPIDRGKQPKDSGEFQSNKTPTHSDNQEIKKKSTGQVQKAKK